MKEAVPVGNVLVKPTSQLSFGRKVGYGLGEVALNFTVAGMSNYLLFFYTDVFGITAGVAGLLMLLGRFWDAANDPLMGIIGDRTQTRWGKYRPYVLFGAAPVSLITDLTFTTPPLSDPGKVIWAYITYFAWCTAFTVVAVPYNALMANLTTDSQERSSLSAIKTIFAVLGTLLVVVLAKPMTESLGSSLQSGYMITFGIFGALAFILFIVCFALTREKVDLSAKNQTNFFNKKQFKALAKNRPLIALTLFFLFFQIAFSLFRSVDLYFFTYVLERGSLYSVAMLAAHICAVAGMVSMPFFVKRFDKKKTALWSCAIGCLFFLPMYFLPGNVTVALVCIALTYLILSIPYALFFGIIPDTVEYGQWKSGIRAAALIVSVFTFTQKLGMALSAALAGKVLEYTGYVADQAQSAAALQGILLLRTIIPVALVVVGALFFLLYNLSREKHQQILEELKIQGNV
jgi:GPH family glycoside/pentoside/hexuronide:cation symporter